MKTKIFEIIITCLLTTLTGMGLYFVDKLESCEVRIWTLETSAPGIAERFNTIAAKIDATNNHIDDTEERIKCELDLMKELVLQLLEKKSLGMSDLDTGIDKAVAIVTENGQ